MSAGESITSLSEAVAELGALPMPVPVGPEPRTLDVVEHELTGARLSLYEEELETARLRLALKSAQRGRLQARETVRQMVDALNGHDCPPPGETPMEAVTRFAVRLMEAERLVAELEAAPTFVYRAEHPDSEIVLGVYSTRDAAAAHCEALATREGATGLVSWVPDDGDALSPEELTYFDVEYCDGDDVPVQTCTGYVVTPLEVASAYDPDADE